MKRDARIWNIICLITASSVFFVVMAEARPEQFRFLGKSLARKNFHVFAEVKHQPDLAFFWMLSQKVNRPHSGLSDEQKVRIQKEFRRLFVQVIAAEQELFSEEQGSSFSTSWQLGQILAEHRKAIHDIFTPEQHRKHRSRKAAARMTAELKAAVKFAQNTSAGIKLTQTHLHAGEDAPIAMHQFPGAVLAQMSPQVPLKHDLHQLQILRL